MTTYEKIIMLIKCGKTPIIKDKNGYYRACLYQKDGIIFANSGKYDINDIYSSNGYSWTKDEVEKNQREIVRIDIPERHIFKEGDIIDLDIEALEKAFDWGDIKKYFGDGKNLEIDIVYNYTSGLYYDIYTKDKSNTLYIGAEYVIPHVEDTPQKLELSDEQLLEEVRRRGLTINGEIIK